MKIYEVVDNSRTCLKTTDRLKALEKLYDLYLKYRKEKYNWKSWFEMYEEELK